MKQIIFKHIIFLGSVLILMLFTFKPVLAQDSTLSFKKNEVWASPFVRGAQYKRAINSNSFLKVGLSFNLEKGNNNVNYNVDGNYPYSIQNEHGNRTDYGTTVLIGFEKRKAFTNKLSLFYGPDILYSHYKSNWRSNSNNNYSNGSWNVEESNGKYLNQRFALGFALGTIYHFNNTFGVGVSWFPEIYYSKYTQKSSGNNAGNYTYTSDQTRIDERLGVSLNAPALNVLIKI